MSSQNSDIDKVGCVDSQAKSSTAITASKSANNQTKRKQNLSLSHQMKSSSTTDLTVASVPNKMPGTATISTNCNSSNNDVTYSKSQQMNTVRHIPRTVMSRGQNSGLTELADDQNLNGCQNLGYENYQCYAPTNVTSYTTSSVTVPISISSPHIGTQHSNYHNQYHNYSNQLQSQQPNSKNSQNDIGNRQNYSHRQNGSNKKMYNSNYKSKRNGNYNNNNNNSNVSNTSSSSDKTYNSSNNNNNNNYSKNNNINNNNEYQRNMANKSNMPITRSGHRSFNSDTSNNISPSRDHYSSSSSSSSTSSVPLNKKSNHPSLYVAIAHHN